MWKEFCGDNNLEIEGTSITSRDIRGTAFTTLTSGGVKKECEVISTLYTSSALAWRAFETTLLQWLEGRRIVHMREVPTLRSIELCENSLHAEPILHTYSYVSCRITAYYKKQIL